MRRTNLNRKKNAKATFQATPNPPKRRSHMATGEGIVTIPPAAQQIMRPSRFALRGESPLEFMLRLMRDRNREWSLRLDAAEKAAPYIHAKQPQAVHVTSEVRIVAVVTRIEAGPYTAQMLEKVAKAEAADEVHVEPAELPKEQSRG